MTTFKTITAKNLADERVAKERKSHIEWINNKIRFCNYPA